MTAGFPLDPSCTEVAMEVETKPVQAEKSEEGGVFYLYFPDQSCNSPQHKCRHSCNIEHVWANLYRCVTSNTSHICDQNCNQKILYDNLTSICIVSRKLAPLTPSEHDVVKHLRRKSDGDLAESCGRRQKHFFRSPSTPPPLTTLAVIDSYIG